MDNDKILLRVAGALDLLIAMLWILTDGLITGIISLVLGIIILSISESKGLDLIDNKKLLIIVAIINVPIYLISSILMFIFIGKLSKYEQSVNAINGPPKKENKESRKIDNLLKLGVLMVIISGILFATTSWNIITNNIKVSILVLFASLFLILSLFTEKKLKLYKTSYMYWILSITFYTLSLIAVEYFGIFGSFLTYDGIGSKIAYFITYLVIGLFTYISYIKYNKNYLAYLSYVSIIFSLYNILTYLNIEVMGVILLLSLVILFINIYLKESNILKVFTKIASYILVLFILKYASNSNVYILLTTSIINFINLTYLTIKKKANQNILNLIFTYILIEIPLRTVNANLIFDFLCTTLYTTVILGNILSTHKSYKTISYIIYTFISFITFGILSSKDASLSVLIPAIYILFNLLSINNLLKIESIKPTKYTTPVAIFLLVSGILNVLDKTKIIEANLVLAFSLTGIIYCIINYLKEEDNIYRVSLIISLTLMLLSSSTNTNIIMSIISILPSIYLFLIERKNNNKFSNIYSYLLLLSSIYSPFIYLNIINLNVYLINAIFIWLLVFIIIISKEDNIKTPTYFYIAIPLLSLSNTDFINIDIQSIFRSILMYYIVFLILKYLVKRKNSKNIIGLIGITLSILLSGVLLLPSLMFFIYFLTLGIILIIIGYKEEYDSFYVLGMVIIILNIIIELKDLWLSIPAWLYLLVIGLSIIVVTTFIQAKKQK